MSRFRIVLGHLAKGDESELLQKVDKLQRELEEDLGNDKSEFDEVNDTEESDIDADIQELEAIAKELVSKRMPQRQRRLMQKHTERCQKKGNNYHWDNDAGKCVKWKPEKVRKEERRRRSSKYKMQQKRSQRKRKMRGY